MLNKHLQLYLVTDEHDHLLERTEAALRGGVTCVQLRNKKSSSRSFLDTAHTFRNLCDRYQVPLVINDRPDIAVLCGADLLHVGQEDLSIVEARKIVGSSLPIGVSVHNVEEAKRAEAEGAAYLGVGSIFPTKSKKNARLINISELEAIQKAVSIPIVLIGGINLNNLSILKPYISDGVAIISAILSAENPEQAARAFKEKLISY
jgi:thiamine-phosphate pyrophosphorylase